MLKNYLKIAIAVLLRRKFLAFVNLFGTVLTLTVLVVAFALADSFMHPRGAQHNSDRILAINNAMFLKSGEARWGGDLGVMFFTQYVKPLRTPDLVSFATFPDIRTAYVEGRKLTMKLRFTDAAYWKILDFEPRVGRVLSPDDIDSGRSVAVINEATAYDWFGGEGALGRSIVVDRHSYEVVGVVRNEPETSPLAYADVWVPLTSQETRAYEQEWLGGGQALLYVNDPAKRTAVREELAARVARFEVNPDPVRFNALRAMPTTPMEDMVLRTQEAVRDRDPDANPFAGHYVARFIASAGIVALLFMLLPAVNMINLNVGRIMERASEIGLRKAAGAPMRALVAQFIFENLVLAALGGLVAFAIAPFVLGAMNDVVRYGQLRLSLPVFAAGLISVAIFGVLSGAYPAWKMARLDPAAALKGRRYA